MPYQIGHRWERGDEVRTVEAPTSKAAHKLVHDLTWSGQTVEWITGPGGASLQPVELQRIAESDPNQPHKFDH